MSEPAPRRTRWWALAAVGIALMLGLATGVFWGDLRRTALDPKVPFQTYKPPAAPDYARREAWALMPTEPDRPTAADAAVDVFFVGPTTYDGGKHWNAPIDEPGADRLFRGVMAPNYAGPFVRVGRIFSPRYRQASLYSMLTLREDAREARRFAYDDVAAAFRDYLARHNHGRDFIVVGVEQGGTLVAHLLAEEVAARPELRSRLVAAYLEETLVPAEGPPLEPCVRRGQTGCLAAWASILDGDLERGRTLLDRALVWGPAGELENLAGRPVLCFNPILGAAVNQAAPARLHQGAANATGLEWGARPAFMARQVSARCEGGLLHVSRPKSASLKPTGTWEDRRRVPGYNLFYADLESDAKARAAAFTAR